MGGVLDFLFEGRPPPSVQTYGETTSDLPKWLSDYTQALIGRANSVAGEEYQPYGGPRLAGLTPDQENAIAITRQSSGNYNPLMAQAGQNAQGALTQTSPYFQQAGKTFTGENIDPYMNPYVQNVIDRGSLEATRTLNEKFLPSVERVFGASGSSGSRSTNMRRTVDQGVRDLTEGLNSQNQAALANAYQNAGTMFTSDSNRLGALGQTVGNLNLDAARTQGALAQTGQDLALKDAAAQAAAGETIQQDEQKSLDLQYEDFIRQQGYPRDQVDWLSSVIRGTPHGSTSTTTGTGPAEAYQPSGASQLGSLVTTGMGIWDMFKKNQPVKARGGPIRQTAMAYKKGGRVRAKKIRGALSYA